MTTLIVPPLDEEPWPTLGPQVCQFLEERSVFGPGDLRGQDYRLDAEKRAAIYRTYEVYPQGHPRAGRRRFKRVTISWRKGTAKTEWAAEVTFAELHPEAPVRCDGFDAQGRPVGRPVNDPYIPMVAYTEEQTEELAYGALYVIVSEGPDADLFDIGLERIMRVAGDGKAEALAAAPDSRDGARTTFEHFDEPLALDTEVPTTAGWSTIGAIQPGSMVFGRDGRPASVLGASPVHLGRDCYRVTFIDGTSMVTDGSHRWSAIDWGNRPRGEQVVTSRQMYEHGTDTGYGLRWRLPRNRGIDGAAAVLPVEPYLLGLWLGDGSTNAGYIHTSPGDYPELSAGIEHTVSVDARKAVVRWLPKALRSTLRRAGLLGNKHIPALYLAASRADRVALLQGLMDSDGHATVGGSCTFVQNSASLCEQVAELVRSLGCPASLTRTADGRSRTGEMRKVHFSPEFAPFRLARKVARRDWATPRRCTTWPAIASIEPVPSVPVRCIAVDTPDHLFVAGRGLNLTHNTHRFTSVRLRAAHETMLGNLPKRPLSDPWSLATTTAYEPGSGSVAEDEHDEAKAIARGEIARPMLFFFHREAGPGYDLKSFEQRVEAVREASGPAAEWSDLEDIASQWDRPGADHAYLERVWLNRTVQSQRQAFNVPRWRANSRLGMRIPDGAKVVAGFDGAKSDDSTGIVVTDIFTGLQVCMGFWIRPPGLGEMFDWEVPDGEVDAAWDEISTRFRLSRAYIDPPYWTDGLKRWQGRWGKKFAAWETNRPRQIAYACQAYNQGIDAGLVLNDGDSAFADHIGNSRKRQLHLRDEKGKPLWSIEKARPDSPNKIDLAMAGVLSWEARGDAIASGMTADSGRRRAMVLT